MTKFVSANRARGVNELRVISIKTPFKQTQLADEPELDMAWKAKNIDIKHLRLSKVTTIYVTCDNNHEKETQKDNQINHKSITSTVQANSVNSSSSWPL